MKKENLLGVLIIIAIVIIFYQLVLKNKDSKRLSELRNDITTWENKVVSLNRASLKDIADAKEATKNINCIESIVTGISPFNSVGYEINPCQLEWLVDNKGWKEKGETVVEQGLTNNPKRAIVTVLPYNP